MPADVDSKIIQATNQRELRQAYRTNSFTSLSPKFFINKLREWVCPSFKGEKDYTLLAIYDFQKSHTKNPEESQICKRCILEWDSFHRAKTDIHVIIMHNLLDIISDKKFQYFMLFLNFFLCN